MGIRAFTAFYGASQSFNVVKPQIELVEKLDVIDDNDWAEWLCDYSLDGGKTWKEGGTVQSDGHMIAPETLTDDSGNPV